MIGPVLCDRRGCKAEAVLPAARCEACGATYHRCADHGGPRGAVRSLTAHATLYHPKKQEL